MSRTTAPYERNRELWFEATDGTIRRVEIHQLKHLELGIETYAYSTTVYVHPRG